MGGLCLGPQYGVMGASFGLQYAAGFAGLAQVLHDWLPGCRAMRVPGVSSRPVARVVSCELVAQGRLLVLILQGFVHWPTAASRSPGHKWSVTLFMQGSALLRPYRPLEKEPQPLVDGLVQPPSSLKHHARR